MSGVTVLVDADPDRDEPASTFHDVVGYVIVTMGPDGSALLHSRAVDAVATPLLARALRSVARQLEAYDATGAWPQEVDEP